MTSTAVSLGGASGGNHRCAAADKLTFFSPSSSILLLAGKEACGFVIRFEAFVPKRLDSNS
jgi:hypothetical protein